jgi:DNA-binding response OmpR family regulator
MPEVELPLNLSNSGSPTSDVTNGASILVIDDEAAIRESLEVLLTLEGYSVRMANDGEQGLRVLEIENFDLVLLTLPCPARAASNCCPKSKNASRNSPSS